jgi:hypothetical protein
MSVASQSRERAPDRASIRSYSSTDESIRGDALWIELQLQLHVFRHREERPVHVRHERLSRFLQVVDVGVVAVSLVGELLPLRVLHVPGPEAEYREERPLLAPPLDQLDQLRFAQDADVEVAVLLVTVVTSKPSGYTTCRQPDRASSHPVNDA